MVNSGAQPQLRDPRQRRRKNRQSRDFDDQNGEAMESPSERIPLHDTVDGERTGQASNSGDGSSGMPQARSRTRRPRRRSRMENGEFKYSLLLFGVSSVRKYVCKIVQATVETSTHATYS